MPAAPSIVDFVTDPQLLGLQVSPAQRTLLKAIYGLPLDDEELALWRQFTGRASYPNHGFSEVTVIAGARAGKDSRIAAPVAVYEATFGGHERHLSRGERAIIPLVAQDQRATKIAFGFIRDYMKGSPLLASLIDEVLASEIVLTNGVTIACFPCTLRSLRGYSIPVAVLDEVAFFSLEGQADADVEVQASVRRGMVGFPTTRLLKISTPYMRSGILFEDHQQSFGQDDPDLLVWCAPSLLMNPSLRAERLERERRRDPTRFAREYEAVFAEDVTTFLSDAWVRGAVMTGSSMLSVPPTTKCTFAVDTSGGGADAFTLAGVMADGRGADRRVTQLVMKGWEKPRGGQVSLEGAVADAAKILRSYGCSKIFGDRYAGRVYVEMFARYGVEYVLPVVRDARDLHPLKDGGPDVREQYLDRSAIYLEAEALFATGKIQILDHPKLIRELKNLGRRPSPGGRDRVDHPRGQHDDYANALCLAAVMARGGSGMPRPILIVEGTIVLGGESDAGPRLPKGVRSIGSRGGPRVPTGGAASRGVATGWGGRVGGQAAWILERGKDW